MSQFRVYFRKTRLTSGWYVAQYTGPRKWGFPICKAQTLEGAFAALDRWLARRVVRREKAWPNVKRPKPPEWIIRRAGSSQVRFLNFRGVGYTERVMDWRMSYQSTVTRLTRLIHRDLGVSVAADASLMHYYDSLGIVNLMLLCEDEFGMKFPNDDIAAFSGTVAELAGVIDERK